MKVCTHSTANNKEVAHRFSTPASKICMPLLGLRALPREQHYSLVLERLHGNTSIHSRFKTAANQPSQTSTPAQVRVDLTRLPALSRCSIICSRVETYQSLSVILRLLSGCSSPPLMMGLHGVWVMSAHIFFFPSSTELVNSRNSPKTIEAKYRRSLQAKTYSLEPKQRFQILSESRTPVGGFCSSFQINLCTPFLLVHRLHRFSEAVRVRALHVTLFSVLVTFRKGNLAGS